MLGYVRLPSITPPPPSFAFLCLPLLPPLFLPVLLSFPHSSLPSLPLCLLSSFLYLLLTSSSLSVPAPFLIQSSPSLSLSLSFSPSLLCSLPTFFTPYIHPFLIFHACSILPSFFLYLILSFLTILLFFQPPLLLFVSPSVLFCLLLSIPLFLSMPPSFLPSSLSSFQRLG